MNEVMKLSKLWPPSVFPQYCLQKEYSGADGHQEGQRCPWQVGHKEDYHLLVVMMVQTQGTGHQGTGNAWI